MSSRGLSEVGPSGSDRAIPPVTSHKTSFFLRRLRRPASAGGEERKLRIWIPLFSPRPPVQLHFRVLPFTLSTRRPGNPAEPHCINHLTRQKNPATAGNQPGRAGCHQSNEADRSHDVTIQQFNASTPSLRLGEGFGAIAVQAFAFGLGFEGEAAVDYRVDAEHEFAAEFAAVGFGNGRGCAVLVEQFHPFFRNFAEFRIDAGFIVTMHAAGEETGAAADEAAVFVAPFHEFHETRRLFLDLLASHAEAFSINPVSQALRRVKPCRHSSATVEALA